MNITISHRIAFALMVAVLMLVPVLANASHDCSGSGCGYGNNYYDYQYGYNYNSGNYNPYNNYYGNYNGYSSSYPYNYYVSPYQQPTCSITLDGSYGYGTSYPYTYNATLRWSSSYATSAYISPDIGSVSTNGVQAINANRGQYTLTVTGPAGSYTCRTAANYSYPYTNYPYAYSNYTYPTYSYPTYSQSSYVSYAVAAPVTSVSLKQVPYTGIGFGPAGDMLAWLSVTLAAFLGAALIVRGKRSELTALSARFRRG